MSRAIRFTGASIDGSELTGHNSIIVGGLRGILSDRLATMDYSLVGRLQPADAVVGTGLIVDDPPLVDAAGGDLLVRFTSPVADAGDRASPYDLEPSPNGGRVNIGVYGNTSEAAVSP